MLFRIRKTFVNFWNAYTFLIKPENIFCSSIDSPFIQNVKVAKKFKLQTFCICVD